MHLCFVSFRLARCTVRWSLVLRWVSYSTTRTGNQLVQRETSTKCWHMKHPHAGVYFETKLFNGIYSNSCYVTLTVAWWWWCYNNDWHGKVDDKASLVSFILLLNQFNSSPTQPNWNHNITIQRCKISTYYQTWDGPQVIPWPITSSSITL